MSGWLWQVMWWCDTILWHVICWCDSKSYCIATCADLLQGWLPCSVQTHSSQGLYPEETSSVHQRSVEMRGCQIQTPSPGRRSLVCHFLMAGGEGSHCWNQSPPGYFVKNWIFLFCPLDIWTNISDIAFFLSRKKSFPLEDFFWKWWIIFSLLILVFFSFMKSCPCVGGSNSFGSILGWSFPWTLKDNNLYVAAHVNFLPAWL